PLPPATGSGENLQPPNRLRDSNMFSVHSKPNGQNQTADSQISTSPERWPQNTAYSLWGAAQRLPEGSDRQDPLEQIGGFRMRVEAFIRRSILKAQAA